jgi:flagellin
MGLSVNTNIAALNSYRNLSVTDNQMNKSLEKLSSGFRINRAADDAAGLAISEGLRSQIGGLKVAVRNTQDGVSVVQTAEGALTETHSILQRMRDLAVQSSNGSNDQASRDAINSEATALKAELNRIAEKTTFNNVKLLDGSYTGKSFQVGYAANDTIDVDIVSSGEVGATSTWAAAATTAATATFTVDGVAVTTGALTASTNATDIAGQLNGDANFAAVFTASVNGDGELQVRAKDASLDGGAIAITGTGINAATTANAAAAGSGGFSAADLNVDSIDLSTSTVDDPTTGGVDESAGAQLAIKQLDEAIKSVSTARANLGALQNRFEHTINNLNVTAENLTASESRIRDTDMAKEMTNFSRTQILTQAGTSMLAQANQASQSILKLLG